MSRRRDKTGWVVPRRNAGTDVEDGEDEDESHRQPYASVARFLDGRLGSERKRSLKAGGR